MQRLLWLCALCSAIVACGDTEGGGGDGDGDAPAADAASDNASEEVSADTLGDALQDPGDAPLDLGDVPEDVAAEPDVPAEEGGMDVDLDDAAPDFDAAPDADANDPNDQDGDGQPASIDCDDHDGMRRYPEDGEDPDDLEIPYDGIDNDCDGFDNVDVDGDGYANLSYADWLAALPDNGEAGFWPSSAIVDPAVDCEDRDLTIHPGAFELLGDLVNQDCDQGGAAAGNDTTPFLDGGYTWSAPRNVVVGGNDPDYLLTTAAASTSAVAYTNPGLTLIFARDAAFDAAPGAAYTWHNNSANPKPIGDSVDMVTGSDRFYATMQYYNGDLGIEGGYTILKSVYRTAPLSYSSRIQYEIFKPEDYYLDSDVQVDGDGRYWTLGCGPLSFSVFAAYENTAVTPAQWSKVGGLCGDDYDDMLGSPTPCFDVDYTGATTCFLTAPASGSTVGVVTLCDGPGAGCVSYDVDIVGDTAVPSATQPYADETWTQVNTGINGWALATGPDGAELTDFATTPTPVLAGYAVRAGDAWQSSNGTMYLAAAVDDETADGQGDVVVAYGALASMTVVVLPLSLGGVSYDAESAAIFVDDDRVFLAASGTGAAGADMVAWLFLGPAAAP